MEIPEHWLEKINKELAEKEVPYHQRPFRALAQWAKENNCGFNLDDPGVKRVLDWFQLRSPEGAQSIGPLFTGVFFFDSHFWRLNIPVCYGTSSPNPLDFVEGLPKTVRKAIQEDEIVPTNVSKLWVDTVDYALGAFGIKNSKRLTGFARELFGSADRELRSCATLLTSPSRRPNSKALESSRMATEMFLKAYSANFGSLDAKRAKDKLGHNLIKTLDDAILSRPSAELESLRKSFSIYPDMGSRYSDLYQPYSALWNGFSIALQTGVEVVRTVTGRHSIWMVKSKLGYSVPNPEQECGFR